MHDNENLSNPIPPSYTFTCIWMRYIKLVDKCQGPNGLKRVTGLAFGHSNNFENQVYVTLQLD